MAVDGASNADVPPAAQQQQPGGRESPLPEEQQAKAVAALAAAARQGAGEAAPAEKPASEPNKPAEPEAAAPSGQGAAAAPAAAPARVPARALYGLPVEEDSQGQAEGQQQQGAAQRPGSRGHTHSLPRLPPMEDDGRLPAYALAGAEGGIEPPSHGGRGRKSEHTDEDPPPGFQPVDLFIGALHACALAAVPLHVPGLPAAMPLACPAALVPCLPSSSAQRVPAGSGGVH